MKIAKKYSLWVNGFTTVAYYTSFKHEYKLRRFTVGEIYTCSLTELKFNLKILQNSNFTICQKK